MSKQVTRRERKSTSQNATGLCYLFIVNASRNELGVLLSVVFQTFCTSNVVVLLDSFNNFIWP